jgi:hypothetical protein
MFLVVVSAVLSSASPPFVMNDEMYHWLRVLQLSRGTLLADKLGDGYWGGQVDKKAYEFSLWIFDKIQKKQPVPSAEAWVTAQTWGEF